VNGIANLTPPAPRRWTLHGLNNGLIFSATYHGVRLLPRAVSYAIGDAGTWLAHKLMPQTRAALADNLAPVLPGADLAARERVARQTLRAYARDVIDFLGALSASPEEQAALFVDAEQHRALFESLLARGRGIILTTGHFGNWEVGSLLIRRALGMPLTIVAMAEPSPTVNRIRHQIRETLGAQTIEVRQSFDTALQIRRCLANNQIVAMLFDRHFGRDRVKVTFLGRDAWLLRTPLVMAHATGAPLVPCFIERAAPGRFVPRLGRTIVVDREQPRDRAIEAAAQQMADDLAERVRARPEFWYHFYRYWDAQRDQYDGLA
jgi:KDO2-lipid IV(A) lauroyltransferase